MVTTYTTHQKVASMLQVDEFATGTGISGYNNLPNVEEVERFINWAEDWIDKETGHAWRSTTVTDEYHDVRTGTTGWGRYAYVGVYGEVPIYLKHREIYSLDSGQGDKLEVWDGAQWLDFLGAGYTEGRGEDYYVDETLGVVYFRRHQPRYSKRGVRVTYRYGSPPGGTVPLDIEEAATILAGIKLLEFRDYVRMIPENTDRYAIESKVRELYNTRLPDLIKNNKELRYAQW
jgi:hypothetical protein